MGKGLDAIQRLSSRRDTRGVIFVPPFLNLIDFTKNERVLVNATYILKATPLKDRKGSLLMMADGSKIAVRQDIKILNLLLGTQEEGVYE